MEEHSLSEQHGEFSLCQRVRERLPDLMEGYLDAMTAEAVRAHLAVCYLCAAEYDEMRRVVQLIETLPFAEPIRDMAPSIMAQIEAKPGLGLRRLWARWRPRFR